jgi:ferric-dicitrate binding protein FerR (iron transport regulator)
MLARQPSAPRWALVTILMATVAANACRFGPGGLANAPTHTASPAPATAAASATLPGRTAVLTDLVGIVLSGPAGGAKDVPAVNGQVLSEGAQVQTGKASKAKINLNDGTILRLRPDTLITLDRLASDLNNPFNRLLLALGKVFVILKTGQLEVQTPLGVATVTGSFLSVEYQADTNTVVVTCLEGNCTLRNDQSGTALSTGQAASLTGGAGATPVLRWMTQDEIQAWLADNPEAQAVAPAALTALPTVTGTQTQTPTTTATATATPTALATHTPTATRKPRPTLRPTLPPTLTPIPPPTLTPTPPPTLTPTATEPSPTPTPDSTAVPGQPLVYNFDNACDPAAPGSPGTYHVTLTGPKTTKFDVAPQQSVNGSLPPGQYVIAWQPDNGQPEQLNYSSDQGPFNWTFCGKP